MLGVREGWDLIKWHTWNFLLVYRTKSGSKTVEFLVVNERTEQLKIRRQGGAQRNLCGGWQGTYRSPVKNSSGVLREIS